MTNSFNGCSAKSLYNSLVLFVCRSIVFKIFRNVCALFLIPSIWHGFSGGGGVKNPASLVRITAKSMEFIFLAAHPTKRSPNCCSDYSMWKIAPGARGNLRNQNASTLTQRPKHCNLNTMIQTQKQDAQMINFNTFLCYFLSLGMYPNYLYFETCHLIAHKACQHLCQISILNTLQKPQICSQTLTLLLKNHVKILKIKNQMLPSRHP